jgi:hypothetical protein
MKSVIKNSKSNGGAKTQPAKVPAKKAPAKKAPAKPAPKKKAGKGRTAVEFMGSSASAVARALGKIGWESSAVVKALAKTALEPRTIRSLVSRGKLGLGAAPADLNKVQLSQLRKLAA